MVVVQTLSAVHDKHLVRVRHYHIKQEERIKAVTVSVSFCFSFMLIVEGFLNEYFI